MPENRLANESSLYLRQHKDNPVDWWPWGPEALSAAKDQGKPILLSVGYAACHWCHVMAHESFEDDATAAQMNADFICIKVDREERPEVDAMALEALRVIGQPQGWPVTLFLSPDAVPFFGGTYFPKEGRQGMPSFQDVLTRVTAIYKEQPDEVAKQATAVRDALNAAAAHDASGEMSAAVIEEIMLKVGPTADRVSGGFGRGQKFPQTLMLDFLWRNGLRTGDLNRQDFVVRTVRQMSKGGIYDHLGGGFARYTVDVNWMVPHFEKMLYDNALLLSTLSEVWKKTQDPMIADRVEGTANWALREMTLPGGGFASALDADSEGVEGRFYTWDEAEVDALLGDGEDAKLFKATYGVGPGGNWEGRTILNQLHPQPELTPENKASLAASRAKLFEAREQRVRPARDEKVLADWNGLMITGLADAAMAFNRPDWLAAAEAAFKFVTEKMSDGDRLYHAAFGDAARHAGIAPDYANMIGGAISLYQATGKARFLDQAIAWEAALGAHFWDAENTLYYLVPDDAEPLAVRQRDVMDTSVPAANGAMLGHLTRLWLLTGKTHYRTRAEHLFRAFGSEAQEAPMGLGAYLSNAELYLNPIQVAIIGRRSQAGTQDLKHAAFESPAPTRIVHQVEPGADLPNGHPAAGKKQEAHKPTAYVCVGATCSKPVTTRKSLEHLLAAPGLAG
jgi:uncharacterized protein YyaL (SSP411 family)